MIGAFFLSKSLDTKQYQIFMKFIGFIANFISFQNIYILLYIF